MTNPCLRPASPSDVPMYETYRDGSTTLWRPIRYLAGESLELLYDAEWRLRGFERSP